ncbi:hypothetical protein EDD36DRAFT_448301 [Exophiala viscosa]|uniref:Uncharacterized protein n=1 Tax=Exophiala viscosa TaxID=2486360 RepID=A0AAN6I973_9EURO|nr:hypothetical protein EDD36DRAFT_448301 [Exophiala viscosa]
MALFVVPMLSRQQFTMLTLPSHYLLTCARDKARQLPQSHLTSTIHLPVAFLTNHRDHLLPIMDPTHPPQPAQQFIYARPVDMSEVLPLTFQTCRFNGGRLLIPPKYLKPRSYTRSDIALQDPIRQSYNAYLTMNDYQRGYWDAITDQLVKKMAASISLALVARQHRLTPLDVVVRIAQFVDIRIAKKQVVVDRQDTLVDICNWILGSMVWEICEGVFPEVVAARYSLSVRDMTMTIAQWGLVLAE